MLITLDVDGRVQFTRNPEALKLVEGLGKLAITRMSEILFNEEHQLYYIRLLTGRYAGIDLCWYVPEWVQGREAELRHMFNLFIDEHRPGIVYTASSVCSCVLLATYEQAVRMEVAFIDFLREQGIEVQ